MPVRARARVCAGAPRTGVSTTRAEMRARGIDEREVVPDRPTQSMPCRGSCRVWRGSSLLPARKHTASRMDAFPSDHRNTRSGSNASPAQESNAREMFPIGVCESQNPQSNEIFTIPFAPSGSGLLRCSCSFARVVASEEPAGSPLAVRPLPGRRYALGFRRNNEMPTPHHKCQGPFDNVEVYLQNAPFPEDEFGHGYQRSLRALAGERASRSEEKIFHELLRYGGGSAGALAFHVLLGSDLDLVPIESIVLVEVRILCGDHSVLEIRRDLAQRNEFVAFAIWRVLNPGLQSAFHMDRGCRRGDPPHCHKSQRGK